MKRLPDALHAERERTVRALWADMTSGAIATRIGVHAADVRKLAARLGLKPRRSGKPPAKIHGTYAEWHRGCRCGACTRANRDYQRGYRAKTRPPCRKALASELTRSRRAPTGHGSLARAKAGCECPRCSEALVTEEAKRNPNGPPRWRCACDAYRVNPGEALVCGGCGQPTPWAMVGLTDRRMA
jgi:hypothetical protein